VSIVAYVVSTSTGFVVARAAALEMTGNVDLHSRYVTALRRQTKTAEPPPSDALSCPYCSHQGRIFQTDDQLYDHATVEHASILQSMAPGQARAQLRDAALRM
jgi:hypothetical protein